MPSAAITDLASALPTQTFYSGSLSGAANNQGAASFNDEPLFSSSISIANWYGNDTTWGTGPFISSSYSGSFDPGLWTATGDSWGTSHAPIESRDRTDTVGNGNPEIDQGIGPGQWSPFPIPPAIPVPLIPTRDLTRFRKAYSSQRLQPKRIRIIR